MRHKHARVFNDELKNAIRFSIKTHEVYQKQKRKGKDIPYIVHPLSVGLILAHAGAKKDVVIAGVLHDTIEDSVPEKKVTPAMLRDRFGKRVAQLVVDVTETHRDRSWDERKHIALEHIATLSRDAVLLKSADLISNVSDIIDDHAKVGDDVFLRFNAPKEKIVRHYLDALRAAKKRWPGSPLASDLRTLERALQEIA